MNAPQLCAGCQKALPKREYLKCMACEAGYDLDCANVSYKFFNLMKKKDQWICPECKSNKPKTGNVNTPLRPMITSDSTEALAFLHSDKEDHNVTHRKRGSRPSGDTNISEQDLTSQDINVRSTAENDSMTELKLYMSELIQSQTDSLRAAINALTDTIRLQNSRIEKLEARVEELENSRKLHPDISSLKSTITDLQAEIHERDQTLLLNDVEIAGYPEEASENCTHIVIALAKKIGLNLDEKDVVSADRAGPLRPSGEGGTPARPRPMAVRLTRRATRDALLQAARVRRTITTEGLPLPGPSRPIYVNERLTKHHRQLFQKARELARSHKFKYVWTREGKIFVRQEDGKARYRLRSEVDLKKVFGELGI